MLIETSVPRRALINCIVDSLCDTLIDRQITLFNYLKELSTVIEINSFPSDCLVLKGNKFFVFLPNTYDEDDLIEIMARIRLRHVRYYDYYNEELRRILDEEVRLFQERYKANINNFTSQAAVCS